MTRKQNIKPCTGKYRIHLSLKKDSHVASSQLKIMLVCFFDHKEILHYEFIAQGQMVTQHCYVEVLMRLQETVWRKRPQFWPD
jgi:hypothetical protein